MHSATSGMVRTSRRNRVMDDEGEKDVDKVKQKGGGGGERGREN